MGVAEAVGRNKRKRRRLERSRIKSGKRGCRFPCAMRHASDASQTRERTNRRRLSLERSRIKSGKRGCRFPCAMRHVSDASQTRERTDRKRLSLERSRIKPGKRGCRFPCAMRHVSDASQTRERTNRRRPYLERSRNALRLSGKRECLDRASLQGLVSERLQTNFCSRTPLCHWSSSLSATSSKPTAS